jgi:hypothetical protein
VRSEGVSSRTRLGGGLERGGLEGGGLERGGLEGDGLEGGGLPKSSLLYTLLSRELSSPLVLMLRFPPVLVDMFILRV